jgi:two-component system repressor protein LuxO
LLIARQFLSQFSEEEGKRFSEFSPQAEKLLMEYHWPGNVRELQNVLRNAIVLNDGVQLMADMLPSVVSGRSSTTPMANGQQGVVQEADLSMATIVPASADDVRPLWRLEKEIIERTIEICGGNIPKAAAMLEISASTIYRKKQTWLAESRQTG